MTSTGLHDTGEEWTQKVTYRQDLITARDASIDIGVYDDATDTLTDPSDVGAITTEPTDGNYARQAVTLDSTDVTLSVVGGDLEAQFEVTFDVTNTTGTADAWFAVVTFQSDIVNAEAAENPHLLASGTFDGGSVDLANYKDLTVTGTIALG